MRRWFVLLPVIALSPSPALAHTGVREATGFAHGLMHPIGGLDHVAAMVAVGFFAALLGGRALWLVPLAFVTMVALGGALGMAGVNVPFVEVGIGLSVVAFGAAVALRLNMPAATAMAFVGFFAVFHGHAHGAEMPDTVSGLAYGAGFVLATVLLHGVGIALGLALGLFAERSGRPIAQAAGVLMVLIGVGVLFGMI